jgi:hypothetical protein
MWNEEVNMRFFRFQLGKAREKPEAIKAGPEDTSPAVVVKEIDTKARGSEDDEDATPRPHGPLKELSLDADDLNDEATGEPDEASTEEAKVREVAARPMARAQAPAPATVPAPAPAQAPAKAEKETDKAKESDSLNDLFHQEEEEENPLDSLIKALPEVTSQELLGDLHEIKEIIRERRQK